MTAISHTERSDRTIVWEPARMVSLVEQRLLANTELMRTIRLGRANPENLRTLDRSRSPRQ